MLAMDNQSMKIKAGVLTAAFVLTSFTPATAAPIYTFPVAGVVDEVNSVDKWSGKTNLGADRGGLSISIIGDDGLRYY